MSFISGQCCECKKNFQYDPQLVPCLIDAFGERHPICQDCLDEQNWIRRHRDETEFLLRPGTYPNQRSSGTNQQAAP